MKTRYVIALLALAVGVAAASFPAEAQPAPRDGGMLDTMPQGSYQCALPGDAAGAAFVPVPSERFSIVSASGYVTEDGKGIYILKGRQLTFTRGPRKGDRFRRTGSNELQKLNPDGSPGRLICTRQSTIR